MSAPALVWLVVGLVTVAALTAVVIGLARHAILLAKTLGRFQEEVQPLAEEIVAEADRAAGRSSGMRADPPFGRP